MDRLIDRPQIVREILAYREPITVLNAPAGMGKSCILQLLARHFSTDVTTKVPDVAGTAPVFWDIPPYGARPPIPDAIAMAFRIMNILLLEPAINKAP